MAIKLVRFSGKDGNHSIDWGIVQGQRLYPLALGDLSTGEVISQHWDRIALARPEGAGLELAAIRLLSPVTPDQQFICQGINYESHVRESGLDPKAIPFNTIFTKAGSCITGPNDDVARPAHVRLLDYEIELGLVMRRPIPPGTVVQEGALHEWLAGLVIVNDLSARDVQLPQGQFYKGKSYRGFGPTGPFLLIPTAQEWQRWPDLRMKLAVNGQPRQDAYCREMIFKPAPTLTELAALQDLHPGDLIATGTPAGCAARSPGKGVMFILKHFFSDAGKWKMFIRKNLSNPAYLRPGDRMTLAIRTDDGVLDLGEQVTTIVHP